MDFLTHVRSALMQLAVSKFRTFLATLGILIGTASVVAMVSSGQLAQNKILDQFRSLGTNLLSVSIYPENYQDSAKADPYAHLSLKEAQQAIQSSYLITNVAPYMTDYGESVYQGYPINASSVGVTTNMFKVAKLHIANGRALSFLDRTTNHCVIGHSVVKMIRDHWLGKILGTQINLGHSICTVVGTLKPWPSNFFFNTDFNSAVIMDIQSMMSITGKPYVDNLIVTLRNSHHIDHVSHALSNYLENHTLKQRVNVRSPKSLIDSMKQSTQTMSYLLAAIGSISLIVGGIGVMNIMLVSIAERRKEIGIRAAIGATERDIQLQFLIEAATLSLIGGIVGTVIGIGVTYVLAMIFGWPFSVIWLPPIVGCSVSILVGVFFGFYPAYKASKMDPIEILHT